MVAGITAVLLAATAVLWTGGRHDGGPAASPAGATSDVVVAHAASPSAIVALSDGGFRFAERRSGRIREVDGRGRLRRAALATVGVRPGPGQRGLLGLAIDRSGATFAAWTRASDGRIVVGQVAPGPTRLVWLGPPSAELANGGRLAFAPVASPIGADARLAAGALVVGIGDLQAPSRGADPDTANGKLLALDPDGRPDQRPTTVSAGWNNPFAFTFTGDGRLWVADNAPGRRPERLARADHRGSTQATTGRLRPLAPSALVALGDHRLGVCGYVSRTMREVRLDGDRPSAPGRILIDKCAVAAAVLADGRVAFADDDTIRVTRRPLR